MSTTYDPFARLLACAVGCLVVLSCASTRSEHRADGPASTSGDGAVAEGDSEWFNSGPHLAAAIEQLSAMEQREERIAQGTRDTPLSTFVDRCRRDPSTCATGAFAFMVAPEGADGLEEMAEAAARECEGGNPVSCQALLLLERWRPGPNSERLRLALRGWCAGLLGDDDIACREAAIAEGTEERPPLVEVQELADIGVELRVPLGFESVQLPDSVHLGHDAAIRATDGRSRSDTSRCTRTRTSRRRPRGQC